MLERSWPWAGGRQPLLLSVEVEHLSEIRLKLGAGAADDVLRAVVGAARAAFGTSTRVYRTGLDELAVLLRVAEAPDEAARRRSLARLEQEAHGALTESRLPVLRLRASSVPA